MAILKVEALLAMPAHLTFTAGLTALPFFHGPMASVSRRLEGKWPLDIGENVDGQGAERGVPLYFP